MRVALAAIVLVSGCNWAFGLHATDREPDPDAPPGGPDAMWSRTELSYLLGPTTAMSTQGAPTFAALTSDPAPAVGPLDAALRSVGYFADGSVGQVEYPPELVGSSWRLVYTPPGGVPHEVQWAPPDGGGHLVVPELGRLARTPVPANTGYTVNTATNYNWRTDATFQTVVYTTGYWSRQALSGSTTSIALDVSKGTSLSGPPGAPASTGGDRVLVLEYENLTCRRARQAGTFAATPLLDGVLRVEVAALQTTNQQVTFAVAFPVGPTPQQRLTTALGTRAGTVADRAIFGRAAHTGMPAFTSEHNTIPAPVFVPLVECPLTVGSTTSDLFVDPTATIDLKGLAFSYVINQRVAGATLPSSLASVVTSTSQTYTPDFNVALATGPIQLGDLDLDGVARTDIPSTPALLTFAVELAQPLDYFEVVLYRISGAALIAERVYVSPNPTEHRITFDPAVMMAGEDYVFAIRTYRGRPDAGTFDMRPVGPVQAMGNVFTGTFRR